MKEEMGSHGEDIERLIGNGVALVDFNAPWCAPCRAQEPIIEDLAGQFEGKVVVVELSIDENRETAAKLGIHSIPTLAIFKNGKEIQRFIGLQSADVLVEAVERALK